MRAPMPGCAFRKIPGPEDQRLPHEDAVSPRAFLGFRWLFLLVLWQVALCRAEEDPWEGWTFVDLTARSVLNTTPTRVQIEAPGGNFNMMIGQDQDAPRFMRPVEGDFEASVRVRGAYAPGLVGATGGVSFNGGGFLLWAGANEFLRFERDLWHVPGNAAPLMHGPLIEYWRSDHPKAQVSNQVIPPHHQGAVWLRVQRRGSTLTFFVATTRGLWREIGVQEAPFGAGLSIGFCAVNTSRKPFLVDFSEFELLERKQSQEGSEQDVEIGN